MWHLEFVMPVHPDGARIMALTLEYFVIRSISHLVNGELQESCFTTNLQTAQII
jgi:hypothetical protein